MALGRIALVSIKGIKREIEKEILGVMSISLTDAVADGLLELKAYGGTEQRNLPSGYTQLEYIQADGTQYIDTGVKVTQDNRVELRYCYYTESSVGTSGRIAGGRYTSGTPRNALAIGTQNGKADPTTKMFAQFGISGTAIQGASVVIGDWFTVKVSTDGYYINDTAYESPILTDDFETPYTVKLFAFEQSTPGSTPTIGCGVGRCSNFKIYTNDVLTLNLIPVKRNSDNELGMYDTVNGEFYTNSGTGSFTAGNIVTPTPTAPMDIVSNNGVLKARHQSGLPTGYTLLDSVTGDGLVGIDTGLTLQAGDEIDLDYEWLGAPAGQGSDRFFFGTSNADTSKGGCRAELYTSNGTSAVWYARFSSLSSVNTQTDMSTQLTGHLTLKQESFTVNNVEILTPSYEGTFQDTTLTYFGRFNATGDTFVGAYIKISKFTLKNNGVYRYYGIPCKNSSNVIGMYDLVSGTFSTKVGTGTFTAGNTVSDPIEIYTDGTTETIEDDLSNTATAEMLLKVGDYADEQEILSGDITRNIGVKVLDGTETWRKTSSSSKYCSLTKTDTTGFPNAITTASDVVCTHAIGTGYNVQGYCSFGTGNFNFNYKDTANDLNDFKQFLADQYNAGTPVIIVYPLETPTTETVTGQTMNIPAGDSDITITQASINTLELSAKYKALPN